MIDKLKRFTGRAGFYARHRPGYPDAVIGILKQRAGWTREAVVADIGAGTGISSELFLRHGNAVWGVEPNADMRAESASLQSRYPQFRMLDGVAEATGLPESSFDFVVAATAFHWFNAERCRTEFARILRPTGGRIVLLWNLHQSPETPFVRAFELLSRRFGTSGRHCWGRERHNIGNAAAKLFGEPKRYCKLYLENNERLDFDGLKGRLLSSAYVPFPDDDRFEPMVAELRDLFDRFAVDGFVELACQTAVFWGELPAV